MTTRVAAIAYDTVLTTCPAAKVTCNNIKGRGGGVTSWISAMVVVTEVVVNNIEC